MFTLPGVLHPHDKRFIMHKRILNVHFWQNNHPFFTMTDQGSILIPIFLSMQFTARPLATDVGTDSLSSHLCVWGEVFGGDIKHLTSPCRFLTARLHFRLNVNHKTF